MFGRSSHHEDKDISALQPGDKLRDGSVYVGISPTTGEPMVAAPEDASKKMTFQAASRYARDLKVGKHGDWRVPSEEELAMLKSLQDEGALRGSFNRSAAYWAAANKKALNAWCEPFSPATKENGYYSMDLNAVRCVRSLKP